MNWKWKLTSFPTVALGFIFLVGLPLLVFSIRQIMKRREFLAASVRVQGTVVGHEVAQITRQKTYRPLIRYQFDGLEREVHFSYGSPRALKVGDTVVLYVNPAAPETIVAHEWFELWGSAFLAGFASVILLSFWCWAFYMSARSLKG